MKTSTEIASIAKHVGEARAVELVAKAGFDCYDFSMFAMGEYDWSTRALKDTGHPLTKPDYLKFVREVAHVAKECGITCNQSHAPFPTYCKEILDLQRRALECTAEAGGKVCVIHPDNYKGAEENAEMYATLLPYAKEYGVKIATENMWNWNRETDKIAPAACSHPKDFLAHILAVNDPFFVACVDLGHAEMFGDEVSAGEMIRTLGSHVAALHIHDNDRIHDTHTLPFTMKIDYDPILRALVDVGYAGDFTLESDAYIALSGLDLPVAVDNMAKTARRLADAFEAMKK